MAPEAKVLPGSGRISWGQAVAPLGDLRSKPGLAEPTVKESLFPLFSPSGEEDWRGMEVNGCVTMDAKPMGMVH